MDRVEGIMLSEISQIEKDILYDITFMSSKKYNKLVNIKKKKPTHWYREQISGVVRDGNIMVGSGNLKLLSII